MTISYPLEMPTDVIGISQITLTARNAVGMTQSPFTYQQQIFRHAGQAWGASISIAPVNREFGEPWVAFLLALEGPTGSFLLGDPLGACPRGALNDATNWFLGSGSWNDDGVWLDDVAWTEDASDMIFAAPVVNGDQLPDTQTISIRTLPVNTPNLLLPGDYIQFGAGATATLHKVLQAVNSDALGSAQVSLWPRPRRALLDGEAVVFKDAKGRFRLASGEQAWEIANNLRYGVSFEAMEAIA